MAAKKQGLNKKDFATMLALFTQGHSVKEISDWLQVSEEFVNDYKPKPKKKVKDDGK